MSASTIFVVRKREEWELKPFWSGVWYYRAPKKGGVVRAFTSEKRARAFHRRLEDYIRTKLPKVNPFQLCRSWEMEYENVTSLPEFALFDWLRDTGLEPPEPNRNAWTPNASLVSSNWYWWWKATVKTMTEEQLDHVWRGLDRVKFYEVVPVPVG
jgi:hypothetical protein